LALVAAGGAAGATLRWALLDLGDDAFRPALLGVNVLGCLVLGIALALPAEATERRHALLHDGVGIGFCGGLTTFSTLAVEVAELGRDGHAGTGATYLALSVILGLGAILLGAALAGRPTALEQPLESER
jgi:CrcB protein